MTLPSGAGGLLPRVGERDAGAPVRADLYAEADRTSARLRSLGASREWGWLELRRPAATAAFSRRDALARGFDSAVRAAVQHGFAPLIRPVGGRLAAYHDGCLVIDVLSRHQAPGTEIWRRFGDFSEAVVRGLRRMGVDARVGEVPGEYCPGPFSVNAGGRTKLAGTGQRVSSRSFLFSAVVLVDDPEPVRDVLAETYPLLGLEWDQSTVGSVADHVPGVSVQEAAHVLMSELAAVIPFAALPSLDGSWTPAARAPLRDSWEAGR